MLALPALGLKSTWMLRNFLRNLKSYFLDTPIQSFNFQAIQARSSGSDDVLESWWLQGICTTA